MAWMRRTQIKWKQTPKWNTWFITLQDSRLSKQNKLKYAAFYTNLVFPTTYLKKMPTVLYRTDTVAFVFHEAAIIYSKLQMPIVSFV